MQTTNGNKKDTLDKFFLCRSSSMVLGVWQYYYTIRDEFCQPLLYTKFKKKEVDHVREERDRIRLMLYRNTLTNAWLVNRLEERGVITEKTEMSSVLRGVRKGAKAETIIKTSLEILDDYESKMGVCE